MRYMQIICFMNYDKFTTKRGQVRTRGEMLVLNAMFALNTGLTMSTDGAIFHFYFLLSFSGRTTLCARYAIKKAVISDCQIVERSRLTNVPTWATRHGRHP